MNYSKQTAFALSLTLIIAACGGGSSGDNDDQNTDLGGNNTPDLDDNDTSGTGGTGSLSECFNPVLFQDGTFYTVVRDIGFGKTTTMTSVTTNIEWNGAFYTRQIQENSQLDSSAIDSRVTSYFSVDFGNQVLEEAGRVIVDFDDDTGDINNTTTEIFTPPIRTRFDLASGEIFTQNYQIDRTRTFNPSSTSDVTNEVEDETKTDRFLGIESINVGVENVDSCRVRSESITKPGTIDENTEILTSWLDKDNGLFVQIELASNPSNFIFKIESAVINGAAVF